MAVWDLTLCPNMDYIMPTWESIIQQKPADVRFNKKILCATWNTFNNFSKSRIVGCTSYSSHDYTNIRETLAGVVVCFLVGIVWYPIDQAVLNLFRLTDHLVNFASVQGEKIFNLPRTISERPFFSELRKRFLFIHQNFLMTSLKSITQKFRFSSTYIEEI